MPLWTTLRSVAIAGVEGLIHVSEMSWTKKIKHPSKMLEIGQEMLAERFFQIGFVHCGRTRKRIAETRRQRRVDGLLVV